MVMNQLWTGCSEKLSKKQQQQQQLSGKKNCVMTYRDSIAICINNINHKTTILPSTTHPHPHSFPFQSTPSTEVTDLGVTKRTVHRVVTFTFVTVIVL